LMELLTRMVVLLPTRRAASIVMASFSWDVANCWPVKANRRSIGTFLLRMSACSRRNFATVLKCNEISFLRSAICCSRRASCCRIAAGIKSLPLSCMPVAFDVSSAPMECNSKSERLTTNTLKITDPVKSAVSKIVRFLVRSAGTLDDKMSFRVSRLKSCSHVEANARLPQEKRPRFWVDDESQLRPASRRLRNILTSVLWSSSF